MPLNRSGEPTSTPDAPSGRTRLLSALLIVLVAVAVVVIGRGVIAARFQRLVTEHISRGLLSDARQWHKRAGRRWSESTQGKLLLARIYRHAGHRYRWEKTIGSLDSSAARNEVRLERRLAAIRWGEERANANDTLNDLVRQGADRNDAAVMLVYGLVDAGQHSAVERVLRQWESGDGRPAQVAWGQGVYHHRQQDFVAAKRHFEQALEMEPGHDNARLGLGEALEMLHQPQAAAEHFAVHLQRWPESEAALLGLSRCSRRQGRIEIAADLMQQALSSESPSRDVWLEAAEVAYFSGDFAEAARRFEKTDLEGPQLSATIRTAATSKALAGQSAQAEELFDRYLAGHSLTFRRQVLESRLREDPTDTTAAEELRQILAGDYVPLAQQPEPPPAISELFSLHCAACHGDAGRGDGPANRHLFPQARDLHRDAYRLVTTLNRFPSRKDIRAVIRGGIAGTSMQPFTELTDAEVDQLTEESYRLRQAGFRSSLIAAFQLLGEQIDEESVDDLVRRSGTAGELLEVPAWPSIGPDELAVGRSLFQRAACDRCHGVDGSGQSLLPLTDERGNPVVARDLVHDPMKGGSDRAALFARLRLGMPGTPHPANPTLDDKEIMYLVEYCLSLADQPTQQSTNYQRAVRADRHVLEAIGGQAVAAP